MKTQDFAKELSYQYNEFSIKNVLLGTDSNEMLISQKDKLDACHLSDNLCRIYVLFDSMKHSNIHYLHC